jgi:formylmethanofuran dehydrogenase subunit E
MKKNDELYQAGLLLHGHTCPAMPMGLRAGLAALEALGVERASDGQLSALVEIGQDHCATCYADGVQMATGCTFGKGNIEKLGYGKFALTLIENKAGRRVRVVTRPETIRRNQESAFIQQRKRGVPASQIGASVVDPLVEIVLGAPTEALFTIEPVKMSPLPVARPHDFTTVICAKCGEVVVERYARVKDSRIVCIPCSEKM